MEGIYDQHTNHKKVRGLIAIVVANELVVLSSNPGQGGLCF